MLQRPFTRLAIVNRGEPAMRLIHAVRELNEQRCDPIVLIALFTDVERHAMFVREADEAVCLGPGAGGTHRSDYLDHGTLEEALVAARADAAWVGWGFVAEDPNFADLCERLGIVFVGPDPAVMRLVGDRIAAKRLAETCEIPVAPWSGGAVDTVEDALRHATRIGFPVVVKAAAGGGGRGIRCVDGADGLAAAFRSAQAEAEQAFGDGTLLLERLVTPARQIEVQVVADGHGTAWAIGVRDCSCRRGHQKVIEESASPALTAEQDAEIRVAAQRLALRAGYRNAGTVEFLYEPDARRFAFMGVNAWLQVEHTVTEEVTGLDLVKLQLHIAAGGRLEGAPPPANGHAVEARLNAEDAALGCLPAPGRVALLRLPTGPRVRVDTGVAEGDAIHPEFGSTIAKLIAWGRDRDEALARLRCAVAETVIVVEGRTTNQGFLLELLDRPELRSGDVDTAWLERMQLKGDIVAVRHADVAVLQAAIEISQAETAIDRARFYAFARRGRPQADGAWARVVELRHRGHAYRCAVSQIAGERHRVVIDGVSVEVGVRRVGAYERRLEVAGVAYRTVIAEHGADLHVEVNGIPHRIGRDDGGLVRNLAPAVVVSIPVTPGDAVEAGDVIAVVESMKMETSLVAPFRGRVRRVLVGSNVHIAAHTPLVQLEALDGAAPDGAAGERISFPALRAGLPGAPQRCRENLERLEWAMLGYDIDTAEVERIVSDLHGECSDLPARHHALVQDEHRLLAQFADLRALSRSRRGEDEDEGELARSPQEHLHAFLGSLDAKVAGLPDHYAEELRSALRHFGIENLDRTPALEEACYRLFLAQQRAPTVRPAVLAILDRWLEQEVRAGVASPDFRAVLDKLAAATDGRDPVLADLARQVRFASFDQPVIAAARAKVYAGADADLEALTEDPERPDRDARLASLVACPQPLAPSLVRRMANAQPAACRALLEATARRYYRMRTLGPFAETIVDGHRLLTTRYGHEGRIRHLATAFGNLAELPAVTAAFGTWAAGLPAGELAVADLYSRVDVATGAAGLAEGVRALLAGVAMPSCVHRVVVGAAAPGTGRVLSAMTPLTFRPGAGGLVEDKVLRGMHPMMSYRLGLARLSEFALDRLPAAEDVYLFHGIARNNPKDERLFALAEVRDLTPLRDADGEVAALPDLERMFVLALEAIRGFQAHRQPSRRLQWNRIVLHVWPTIDLTPGEIRALAVRLAPLTARLGVEMVLIQGRLLEADGTERDRVLRLFTPAGQDVVVEVDASPSEPLRPLDEGAQRMIAARRRGLLHPAEIIKLLAPAGSQPSAPGQPAGAFVEHDLDEEGRLVPVERPPATNPAGIVVGLLRNFTERHPEGMERVTLLGDPTRALGALAEPECRRIIAALELAEELSVPLEWFALSAGARIAMDSGTETMDWIAAVLRRIIEFTQRGGEINVVVAGINVGAQPYWNAEATMLMHTKGILVMTPDSAMVLTGKQALDYAGGVSAEDNLGIGGYERIMGPNGQAQYWARDLSAACRILLAYYEHTYVAPGERFPRRARTTDPVDRDIRSAPHAAPGSDLARVGDVFSDASNPGRKKPFDIRSVMGAVIDADNPPLERWAGMRDAEIGVVWDAHLGGWPVAMIGIESHVLPRHGVIPADGPERWTSGTLFPRSSKKIARAVNAASGSRALVVLANLAGFDGSPESMREWQLEFGAEIGRAVVNFDGPIVFCVVSRFHGGAFVVFSQRLNEHLEAIALEGAHASVIGGAPAAAVVFARDVERHARNDARIVALDARIERAEGLERQRLRAERAELWNAVLSEKRGEFATEFDRVHSVERAVRMGSVSRIITPAALRPFLIEAVERGMRRTLED